MSTQEVGSCGGRKVLAIVTGFTPRHRYGVRSRPLARECRSNTIDYIGQSDPRGSVVDHQAGRQAGANHRNWQPKQKRDQVQNLVGSDGYKGVWPVSTCMHNNTQVGEEEIPFLDVPFRRPPTGDPTGLTGTFTRGRSPLDGCGKTGRRRLLSQHLLSFTGTSPYP